MTMRIGANILYKDGQCWQSYGWNLIRPLGNLITVIEYLDNYGCDEISIIRPIRKEDNLDALKRDLEEIKLLKTMTPLCFGGGIRTIENLNLLRGLPIERIVLSSGFINTNKRMIKKAIELYGRQAIIAMLPSLITSDNELKIYNSAKNTYEDLNTLDINFIADNANEIVVHDIHNEGIQDKFNIDLLDNLKRYFDIKKLIISGGTGLKKSKWAHKQDIASFHIENRVLHNEYSIKSYRNA